MRLSDLSLDEARALASEHAPVGRPANCRGCGGPDRRWPHHACPFWPLAVARLRELGEPVPTDATPGDDARG